MDLYILRHGQAEFSFEQDHLRKLTRTGLDQLHNIYYKCQSHLDQVEHMLTSPYVRAQQSQDEIWRLMDESGYAPDRVNCLHTCDYLTPDESVAKSLDELYQFCHLHHPQSVLIVSHQPLVSSLVEVLCHGAGALEGRYPMGTASLAHMTLDVMAAGCGELQWLKAP